MKTLDGTLYRRALDCSGPHSAHTRVVSRRVCLTARFGTLTPELYDAAMKKNWTAISMKNDSKRIFSFE
jgi:hypothetical protein